jgi:hypothetical protein
MKEPLKFVSMDFESIHRRILFESLTYEEKGMFAMKLHLHEFYHETDDFIINLEDIFKIYGFTNKGNAKRALENNFSEGLDYKKVKMGWNK